jgi:hypothetical protein
VVQLHPEDDYVMVVKAEAVDLVIATIKVQAQLKSCDSIKTLQLDILNIWGIQNKNWIKEEYEKI